jgi:hypothetical protein
LPGGTETARRDAGIANESDRANVVNFSAFEPNQRGGGLTFRKVSERLLIIGTASDFFEDKDVWKKNGLPGAISSPPRQNCSKIGRPARKSDGPLTPRRTKPKTPRAAGGRRLPVGDCRLRHFVPRSRVPGKTQVLRTRIRKFRQKSFLTRLRAGL